MIQRLGKFDCSLNPGLNFIIPYVDVVAYKVTTKDIVLNIPSQEVITKDNAVLITNAVAYINIISPEKAVYGVEDYIIAIQTLVQTSLRSIVGEMTLDAALARFALAFRQETPEDVANYIARHRDELAKLQSTGQ